MNSIIAELPNWYVLIYIFAFGVCVGSLLNVIVLRGLSGEDFIFARSKCPKCNNQLKWYMNIPVFSFIFLRGKCAFCNEKISIQYPIVELLTGLLFIYSYYKFGLSLNLIFSLFFLSISLVIFLTDFMEKVIICNHTYFLTFLGILYSIFANNSITLLDSFLGLIFGFVILEIISVISKIFFHQRAFGEGDSLILMSFGSILGIKYVLVLLFLAILIQSFLALPFMIKKNFNDKNYKLGFSYLYIIFSVVCLLVSKILNINTSSNMYLTISIFIILGLFWAFKNTIVELKNKREKFDKLNIKDDLYNEQNPYMLLPFGPSLVLSFFICFYFSDKLIQLIKFSLY